MRRTHPVTIAAEGRDKGKCFIITEMEAEKAEEWALRALLGAAKSGIELPPGFQNEDGEIALGMASIAALGLQALAGIRFEDAKPLLDEMMDCVEFVPDPKKPGLRRELYPGDIEEVATRLKLRREVWILHTGFSTPAGTSISTSAGAATGD